MEIAYSTSGEIFHRLGEYKSHQDSFEDALNESGIKSGEPLWLGRLQSCQVEDYFPYADDILEGIGERAYDDVGEAADDWPNATKVPKADLEREIHAILSRWINEYDPCRLFRVTSITKYILRGPQLEQVSE